MTRRFARVAVALLLGALLGAMHTLPAVTRSGQGDPRLSPAAMAAAMSWTSERAAAAPHLPSARRAGLTPAPSASPGRPGAADEVSPGTAPHTGPGCNGHQGLCLSDVGPRARAPATAPAPAAALSTVVLSQGMAAARQAVIGNWPEPRPPLSRADLQVWRC